MSDPHIRSTSHVCFQVHVFVVDGYRVLLLGTGSNPQNPYWFLMLAFSLLEGRLNFSVTVDLLSSRVTNDYLLYNKAHKIPGLFKCDTCLSWWNTIFTLNNTSRLKLHFFFLLNYTFKIGDKPALLYHLEDTTSVLSVLPDLILAKRPRSQVSSQTLYLHCCFFSGM